MAAGVRDRSRRVTDLFVTGSELVLAEPEGEPPVVIWVSRPNAFDMQEIRRSAAVARDARRLMLGPHSAECTAILENMTAYDNTFLLAGIMAQHDSEVSSGAQDDVESAEDFQEDLQMLRVLDAQNREGLVLDEEAQQALADLNAHWLSRYNECADQRRRDLLDGYEAMTRDELEEHYLDAWRQLEGIQAFTMQYDAAAIWRSAKDCFAVRSEDDPEAWDHKKCTHLPLYENPAEVKKQPDELLMLIRATMQGVPDREAAKSDAPASSSAPSEPASEAADSAPSGPAD